MMVFSCQGGIHMYCGCHFPLLICVVGDDFKVQMERLGLVVVVLGFCDYC